MNENKKKGRCIVLSAPSGAGKTTLCRMLVREVDNAVNSISATSRLPRSEEKHGEDYYFVSREEFVQMVENNKFLEWAEVHDNYYGTPRDFVEENLNDGNYVIFDIDVQGGVQIKEQYPDAVTIFIMPPSLDELKRRITDRKQDSAAVIKKRLDNSHEEIEKANGYDYVIVNNELKIALNEIEDIIYREKG